MKYDFTPYLNPVFIETGSADGDGIQAAIDSGFTKIISIELSEYCYDLCTRRFQGRHIRLYRGDSVEMLKTILPKINERCTFWLDAHYCGAGTAGKDVPINIMEELAVIATHHIKDHTILIDDMRLVRNKNIDTGWQSFPYCVCDIEEFLHVINPHYKISYDYGIIPDDILIAQV